MDCPICQTKGLSEETSSCPHCKTDLRAIGLIEKADQAYSAQKKQKTLWILLAMFFVLAFIASLVFPFSTGKYVPQKEYQAMNDQLKSTQDELQQAKQQAANLQKEFDAVKSKEEAVKCDEFTYVVQWGENLSTIASAVYGDGNQYAKIAADNSLDDPNHILDGQKLTIRY
ncbi:MAG TPA: LysM peptidoglycan-binding domain-containing protein [Sunxiuqinia sp.]|nr:LysM peptidoglycan-binding domain-containing protein [Sunxiuqinia sp.]